MLYKVLYVHSPVPQYHSTHPTGIHVEQYGSGVEVWAAVDLYLMRAPQLHIVRADIEQNSRKR